MLFAYYYQIPCLNWNFTWTSYKFIHNSTFVCILLLISTQNFVYEIRFRVYILYIMGKEGGLSYLDYPHCLLTSTIDFKEILCSFTPLTLFSLYAEDFRFEVLLLLCPKSHPLPYVGICSGKSTYHSDFF